MIKSLRKRTNERSLIAALVAVTVLLLAFMLGRYPSTLWLGLLVAAAGGLAILARPVLGLLVLVLAALVVPLEFDTGTEVSLNVVTLLVPAVLVLWILAMVVQGRLHVARSAVNRPLLLFLAASLLSLLVGIVTWDPMIPRSPNFTLVQLAQWAIFAFSAIAFWLTANLANDARRLWRLTATFLLVGGGVAILRAIPGLSGLTGSFTTIAFIRAPFWGLLVGLSGGQLLFNRELTFPWRAVLVAILGASLVYAFVHQQEAVSNWVALAAVLAVLIWLRFPRLRWPLVLIVVALAAAGVLVPSVYEFAGGEDEWLLSGGSRIALSQRVIELTRRNPFTGLGPAAYRPYGLMGSLKYEGAFYQSIALSSHNNYVDIFSHNGLLGLALFAWFAIEIARLGIRLRGRYRAGFAGGYVNGMLAAGAASLVLMLLADWILPFVYNIGFPGFQASVLVWLFMGGLVALDNMNTVES